VIGTGRSLRTDLPFRFECFDASVAVECERFWTAVVSEHPHEWAEMDVCLVNNAGQYFRGSALDTSLQDYEDSIKANYLTGVLMTRSLLEVKDVARVINVLSTSALQAKNTNSAYGSAKAGLMQFFRSLQQEFDARKVRITNLYPSSIRTHGESEDVSAIEPEDLAALIAWHAESSESYYVAEASLYPSH
jgi:NAD(P)-dependent dehydrogenase (short-subunit alcohol dehydrogenase family)